MKKLNIENFIELVYNEIYGHGAYCKGCPSNEETDNVSDYGDGTAIEKLRECTLSESQHNRCPGVREFVTEIKEYANKKGI